MPLATRPRAGVAWSAPCTEQQLLAWPCPGRKPADPPRLPTREAEVRAFIARVDQPSDPNSITVKGKKYPYHPNTKGKKHYEAVPGVRGNIGWHGRHYLQPNHPKPHPKGIRIVPNLADTGRVCGEPTGGDGVRWDKRRNAVDCGRCLGGDQRRARSAQGGLRAFRGSDCYPTFSHAELLFPTEESVGRTMRRGAPPPPYLLACDEWEALIVSTQGRGQGPNGPTLKQCLSLDKLWGLQNGTGDFSYKVWAREARIAAAAAAVPPPMQLVRCQSSQGVRHSSGARLGVEGAAVGGAAPCCGSGTQRGRHGC